MKKSQLLLLALSALAIFALVYSIHLDYRLPFHIDEWHHISEATRLGNYGEYFQVLKSVQANRFSGIEIGFHFILFVLSFAVNLVQAYQFLPAIWAAISALALFFTAYKKSGNFWIGWLALIFFAAIRSNVNITGIWFFTPLSFSLPFIFLYFYFFSEGIENNNNKQLLISLAIMLFLIPTHSISLIFALPALAVYAAIHARKLAKQPWMILSFLVLAIIGIYFYKLILSLGWSEVTGHLLSSLQFPVGWGVIDAKLPLTDVYSWFGYIAAIIGVIAIFLRKEANRYSIYLLWPATVFIMILVYMMTGISYLSPYQRNLYYLAISLPFLSALGAYHSACWLHKLYLQYAKRIAHSEQLSYALLVVAAGLGLYLLFNGYYSTPDQFRLYRAVTPDDAQILDYLATQPRSTVMAPPMLSTALFAYAKQDPVGDLTFYGNPREVANFFLSEDCIAQNDILGYFKVKFVISPFPIDCYFSKLIRSNSSDYLYQVDK